MYINFVNEENKNIYISYWLLLITFLVALMVVVGGLTRLTDSGLSITKWDLFSGIVPPLNIDDWENLFSLYKRDSAPLPFHSLPSPSLPFPSMGVGHIAMIEYVIKLKNVVNKG